MRTFITLFLLAAFPAQAQDTITAQEFENLFSGKTVQFERSGQPFGKEQYFPDRRVIWAFESGQCQHGIWFPNDAGQICFAYEGQNNSQCWDAFRNGSGDVTVRAEGAAPAADLTATEITEEFIDCPLPDVGV